MIKMEKRAILPLLAMAYCACAFQPLTVRRSSLPALRSTIRPASDQMLNLTKLVQTDTAVQSLEKLLERQQKEVRITERLLSGLKTGEVGGKVGDGDAPLSYANSLVSGFDYGFISRSQGGARPFDGDSEEMRPRFGPPPNLLTIGIEQFWRNWDAIKGEYKDEPDVRLSKKQTELRSTLKKLTLNSTAIWERELADGPIVAPWVIKAPYLVICYLLDVVFEKGYVPSRFFLLETVARMPYFSYIALLHLYETIGFWRSSADIKRVHFAEELNEYRHLLIMESLGGDQQYWVRFIAQHSAIAYFIILGLLWMLSPSLSYKFSELLETHAVNTYGVFLDENEELLKQLPPPTAAVEYYSLGMSDPFYAEFQTSALKNGDDIRRPGEEMTSLFDVFQAIKADEGDHASTMEACLDPTVAVQSPSIERRVLIGIGLLAAASMAMNGGVVNPDDFGAAVDATASTATEGSLTNILIDAAIGAGAAIGVDFGPNSGEAVEAGAAANAAVESDLLAGAISLGVRKIAIAIGRFVGFFL